MNIKTNKARKNKSMIQPRQHTSYSCGCASLSIVLILIKNKYVPEKQLIQQLTAKLKTGVCHKKIHKWAMNNNLPVTKVGENSYSGGLAIANIRNIGNEHFVIKAPSLFGGKSVQKIMINENISIAGLDFLNDCLIEVNITCPSAVPQINKVNNTDIVPQLIQDTHKFANITNTVQD